MRLALVLALLLAAPLALPAVSSADVAPRLSSLSPLAARAVDLGAAPGAFPVTVAVGLQMRDRAGLDAYLAQGGAPLPLSEVVARWGPTADQEARVVAWLQASGFATETTPSRLLVVAHGDNAAVQRAFGVPIHLVTLEGAPHHAALDEPRFPADVAGLTTGVTGLDDLAQMAPRASVGGCCSFSPADVKTLYHNAAGYDGTGQTLVIAGAYAWQATDVATFDTQFALPALPAGSGQVCTGSPGSIGCSFSASQSLEIGLDVQYAHGAAPGAVVLNYMAPSAALTDFQIMYNRVVVDNPGHVVSTSWGACEGVASLSYLAATDNIFAAGAAEGQSWFAASGDSGRTCNGLLSVDYPASSPSIVGVGGTHASCSSGMTSGSPACGGYGSESAWSGSGGGRSVVFSKPSWQTGCGVPADGARDVPDVALESDTSPGNYVRHNGGWSVVGGTSDAAPQWAGWFAALNQKKGGSGLGLANPQLYALCGTAGVYHDITTGSNGYSAGTGYDLVTGLGTPDVSNLLAGY
ncbi:MAG: hypothetical protein QOE90_3260 [Thermoplasmata archaeon]|jgi:kumamolisin|nr:hypothetical protein [Thermoplasmata archaeon]